MKKFLIFLMFLFFYSTLKASDSTIVVHLDFESDANPQNGCVFMDPYWFNNTGPDKRAIAFLGQYDDGEPNVKLIGGYIKILPINFRDFKEFTISIWVKEDSIYFENEGYVFFGNQETGWLGIERLNNWDGYTDKVAFAVGGTDKTTDDIILDFDSTYKHTWTFYAMTYKNDTLRAYINGKLKAVANKKLIIDPLARDTGRISSHLWYNEFYYSSRLKAQYDDFFIYKRALSDSEISAQYHADTCYDFYPFDFYKVGSAQKNSNMINLCPPHIYEAGAAWLKQSFDLSNSINLTFNFKYRYGSNEGHDDGTSPNADGIAVVFKGNDNLGVGETGGGIGYDGLDSCLVVEYDDYLNTFEKYFGKCHVAVNYSAADPVHAVHLNDYIKTCDSDFVADNSLYFGSIVYNAVKGTMDIYLGHNGLDPVFYIHIDTVNKIFSQFTHNNYCRIGFTSGTGNAYESCDLLNVELCTPKELTLGVAENEQNDGINQTIEDFTIYPNPASDHFIIQINDLNYYNARAQIYNMMGDIELETNLNGLSAYINANKLSSGTKLIRISSNSNQMITKIIQLIK